MTSYQLMSERDKEVTFAQEQLALFEYRYGYETLQLAMYAAFPMVLTPELLYYLLENRDQFTGLAEVPWCGAADVLLSSLCQRVGHNLYEMSAILRNELLEMLLEEHGEQQMMLLSDFMANYIVANLEGSLDRAQLVGGEPVWLALAFLQPGKLVDEIKRNLFVRLGKKQEGDEFYWAAVIKGLGKMLGEPLVQNLQDLAQDVEAGKVSEFGLARDWSDWAKGYGIELVTEHVQVSWLEFSDDVQKPDLNPNILQDFEFTVVTLDRYGDVATREQKWAKYFIEPLGEGVPPLELVAIKGGEFLMGSPVDEESHRDNEEQHLVKVSPFFMGKYPVTQAQWRYVASELPPVARTFDELNPSHFKGEGRDDCPVTNVSWLDAQEFCARVKNLTGRPCRLPTEAEWEYACRADTITPFHFGETISSQFVNYDGNYTYGNGRKGEDRNRITPVGSLGVANSFGLYDMHGNVWEWCEDHYNSSYQETSNDGSAWINPVSEENSLRVLRGGSWILNPYNCRSAYRLRYNADNRNDDGGFRVVYSPARILR
jgi:formylglycine-generating enzyme required for sulfatase activity